MVIDCSQDTHGEYDGEADSFLERHIQAPDYALRQQYDDKVRHKIDAGRDDI